MKVIIDLLIILNKNIIFFINFQTSLKTLLILSFIVLLFLETVFVLFFDKSIFSLIKILSTLLLIKGSFLFSFISSSFSLELSELFSKLFSSKKA